jgi:hypothetical protein
MLDNWLLGHPEDDCDLAERDRQAVGSHVNSKINLFAGRRRQNLDEQGGKTEP